MKFTAGFLLACAGLISSTYALEIDPPAGWRSQSHLPRGVLFQSTSPDTNSTFCANLVATKAKLPCCREVFAIPDSLLARVAGQQSRVLPQFRVLEKRAYKAGDREGGFMVSSYARGEDDLACLQFFYLDGQDFVSVVFTCLLKDLPALRPKFEKSLASLKTVDIQGPPASLPPK